jgi:hypothetical protein
MTGDSPMNEVIRQLYARKSVRVFTDQEILMAAAMGAYSGESAALFYPSDYRSGFPSQTS